MLRRNLLRSLLATLLPPWLKPGMPQLFSNAGSQEADSAAIYRWAIGEVKVLRPEHSDRLRTAAAIAIDDPKIDALIRQARPVLKAIRKAAAIGPCDWGIDTVATDDLTRGHLDVAATDLIGVACLSARRQAAGHRFREALDDVFAGLTLAHRIGTGGVLFARLLECGGEVPAFQTLGQILPLLNRPVLEDLSHRLEALPLPEPASAAIGPESRFIVRSLRAKLMTMGALIGDDDWAELGFEGDDVATLKRSTGAERTALLAHLESTGPVFAELACRLDLPRPGCRAALDEFASAERAVHPVVAMLVESAWGVRHVVDRMLALRAMLRAGLALTRSGEPAFRMVTDPFGTGPFQLECRGKGFVIRSALSDEGKPEVALAVGDAA